MALGSSFAVSCASLIALTLIPVIFSSGSGKSNGSGDASAGGSTSAYVPSPAVVQALSAFAVGALMGDALLHQLPHAYAAAASGGGGEHGGHTHAHHGHAHGGLFAALWEQRVGISVMAGVLIFYVVERFVKEHGGHGHGGHGHRHSHGGAAEVRPTISAKESIISAKQWPASEYAKSGVVNPKKDDGDSCSGDGTGGAILSDEDAGAVTVTKTRRQNAASNSADRLKASNVRVPAPAPRRQTRKVAAEAAAAPPPGHDYGYHGDGLARRQLLLSGYPPGTTPANVERVFVRNKMTVERLQLLSALPDRLGNLAAFAQVCFKEDASAIIQVVRTGGVGHGPVTFKGQVLRAALWHAPRPRELSPVPTEVPDLHFDDALGAGAVDKVDPDAATADDVTDWTDNAELASVGHLEPTAVTAAPRKQQLAPMGYLNLIADGVHNFTDGMAIGAAFITGGPASGWSKTLFMLAHELPQEVGDYGILLQAGFGPFQAIFFNFLSALVALLGTALALAVGSAGGSAGDPAIIEGFTAGGFIYIAGAAMAEMQSAASVPGHTLKADVVQIGAVCVGVAVCVAIHVTGGCDGSH
jgi:zinc transporter ZupT